MRKNRNQQYSRRLLSCIIITVVSIFSGRAFDDVDNIGYILNAADKTAVVGVVYSEAGKDLVFPDKIEYGNTTYKVIGIDNLALNYPDDDLYKRTSLKYDDVQSVHIPAYFNMNYTPGPFKNCRNLQGITVSPENKYYYSRDNVLYNYNVSELLLWPAKKPIGNLENLPITVNTLGEEAFLYNSSRTDVTIPSRITRIKDFCFYKSCVLSFTIHLNIETGLRAYDSDELIRFNVIGDEDFIPAKTIYGCNAKYIDLPKEIKEINQSGLCAYKQLNLSLPSIEKIGRFGVAARTILLGENVGKVTDGQQSCGMDPCWLWMCDRDFNQYVCSLSPVPPKIPFPSDQSDIDKMTEFHQQRKLFVPAEAVESYSRDVYWCAVFGEIKPITDPFLPVIDQAKPILIKQWHTFTLYGDVLCMKGEQPSKRRWCTDDPTIATIDNNGLLTGVGIGNTKAYYSVEDKNGKVYHSTKVDVYVMENVSEVNEIKSEDSVESITAQIEDGVYDLYGRRISDRFENIEPGLYIICKNGKISKYLKR